MKKLLTLIVLLAAAAAPLLADSGKDRTRFVTRMETCEAILREFQADSAKAIPTEVLRGAKGLLITSQYMGGLIVGFQEGFGTVLVKKANGQWSVPVVMRAGEASLGLQIGGSRIESIYVLMDEQTPRLLFENRFNIGADAAAIVGPTVSEIKKSSSLLNTAPVLVYSNQKGLFAGASVKSSYIARSDAINRAFYALPHDLPELLYGDFVNPTPAEVKPLMDYVTQITK